jgi:glycosyltransferase involved in cell wall biosynthesis
MRAPTLDDLPSPPPGKTGWPWTEETPAEAEDPAWKIHRPRISIITPSLNQGEFIEETIRSVLLQGYPNLEYIIIDGGSDDDTIGIVRRYETWISFWLSEQDEGQAHAINKGFERAKGDILAWLNSDDVYYPGALAAVRDFFERNPGIDVLYGDADHIDKIDKIIEPYYTEDWDYERLKEVCFVCQPSVFLRRRLVEKEGLLDYRLQYCMDYEYWLRLGARTRFARLKKKLAGSRMYSDNKTLGSRVAVLQEINNMLKKRFGVIHSRWIYAYSRAVVDEYCYDRTDVVENLKYIWKLLRMSLHSFVRWRQLPSIRDIEKFAVWIGLVK